MYADAVKSQVLALIAGMALAGCSSDPAPEPQSVSAPATWDRLLPRPSAVTTGPEEFVIDANATIVVEPPAPGLEQVAGLLAEVLRPSTGYPIPVLGDSAAEGTIRLSIDPGLSDLGDEGYVLTVDATGITIQAATAAGVFYGTQTFRQMLPARVERRAAQAGPWRVATGTIRDTPRFAWRGLMVDVARHFFTPEEVRRYVDVMATYKMNRLHLHLTDDQGWRIQIDAWPSLTAIGGATEVGGGPGGHYTKADYADLVDYAAARFVTVVPEIDMPGHTRAALASIPELNCDGQSPEPYTGTSIGISSLCIGLPVTETFVRDVIGEVAAMTPGPYLHVGGDEAKKTTDADYVSFMTMARDAVKSNGKVFLGWEEVARIELGADDVSQHWLDEELASAAAAQGAKILLSPATRTYLDMKYDLKSPPGIGTFWAGFIDVPMAYDWNPGAWLDGIPETSIVGIEAPVWTETLATKGELDAMVFPRLLGYAELGWSSWTGHDVQEYVDRLGTHGPRLEAMGIGYYPAPEVPWGAVGH